MRIIVWKEGGIMGLDQRLGPVDTDRVSGAVGSAIDRMIDEVGFFDLSNEAQPGQGAVRDAFYFSFHIVDGERQNQVWPHMLAGPAEAKLFELLHRLQKGGFEFEDQKN